MQLLPVVEMFCKWELQEDCTDLVSLMHRFDSQHELESHALGRSLLAMLADEDGCFESAPEEAPIAARPSPFDSVRERLAAAASAIRHLQVQAHLLACPSAVFEFYTGGFDICTEHKIMAKFLNLRSTCLAHSISSNTHRQ